LLKQDVFTSVYTEEFICDQQETQLGPEIITRDIPNISEKALRDLDEDGIIRLGAEVEGNDILVGKISPKGEVELTPEERLMRAIFGSESKEVRNTSLSLKHGRHGRVIKNKILSRKKGDKLEVGIIKRIFIEIAELRKVKVGDKLAGRHGNKGIISIVAPAEDMPFLEDGTPVDIVINALSIPNRMNLGQIFESQLGLAADRLHYQAICPPFDGATEEEIKEEMNKANIDTKNGGKVALFDGRTGQKFEQLVTIGKIYMMKLNHMVADKMHARSVGPYALITQQPLKGRSQMGGQRFGEMEV
jgi:DNA-directed RNA polymerase subunit beta